jgi:hypothetical protein
MALKLSGERLEEWKGKQATVEGVGRRRGPYGAFYRSER